MEEEEQVVVEEKKQGIKREREEEEEFKLIPLRKRGGEVVGYSKCSVEDFEELNKYKWGISEHGYAKSKINGKQVRMSRFVKSELEKIVIPDNYCIDHRNNEVSDNRRTNLRIASATQNNFNKSKRKNATSKYFGVSLNKNGKYEIYARKDKKTVHLGFATTEDEGARIYDKWCVKQDDYKEGFRRLNFPENENIYLMDTSETPRKKLKQSSKYYGVSKNSRSNTFVSQIKHNRIHIRLLNSSDEIECARAFDKYIYENKMNRKMNFPHEWPDHNPILKIKTHMQYFNETTVKLVLKKHPEVKALVDLKDYDKIKHKTTSFNQKRGYITIYEGTSPQLLHRYIMNETNPQNIVDHINGIRTDCRKENLRIVTPSENSANRKKNKNAASKYFGVALNRIKPSPFTAAVTLNRKKIFVRNFKIEEDAARCRDLFIMKNIPNSTFKMNFIWTSEEKEEWTKRLNL